MVFLFSTNILKDLSNIVLSIPIIGSAFSDLSTDINFLLFVEIILIFSGSVSCYYYFYFAWSTCGLISFLKFAGETFHSMNSELGELPAVELSTLPLIPEVLLCFYSYFI
jgi:hypothetical protein